MTIKSIDDRRAFASLRIVGRLHKGAPRTDPRRPGTNLTTFRFVSDIPEVREAFIKAYGTDVPAEVRCYLPYAQRLANWDYYFEAWGGKRLKYRCDGIDWIKWLTPDGKSYSREAKHCPYCTGGTVTEPPQGEHTPTGRLQIIIPDLLQVATGIVLLTTTSITDIYSINSCFETITATRTDGSQDLRGIEIILRRQPRDIPTKAHGVQRMHVVTFEPVSDWIKRQLGVAQAETSTAEATDATDEPPPSEAGDEPLTDGEAPGGVWQKDQAARDSLTAKLAELGLVKEDVLKRLGIPNFGAYPGTYSECVAALYAMVHEGNEAKIVDALKD